MTVTANLQNQYQQSVSGNIEAPERSMRAKRSVADFPHRWPDGVITVALDLQTAKSQALVVDAIREWAHHAPSLRFEIVEGKRGDIRISDNEDLKGNWSAIGTYARDMDENQPTLHLDRTDDSKAFRSTALHEFGHALGLLHEHQHPENTLGWNRHAVYDHYHSASVPLELIHEQLLDVVSDPQLTITPYDRKSVMHYHVPGHLRNNGQDVPGNTHLSKGDQEIIRKLYTPKLSATNA